MSESIGPFFNCKEAADFCGYSHSYFEKMVNRFKIKRYGPSKHRFARADLEAFMACPELYATGAARKASVKQHRKLTPNQRPILTPSN